MDTKYGRNVYLNQLIMWHILHHDDIVGLLL